MIQLVKQFKKKKINEISTAARWNAVDILSFFKSIGLTGATLLTLEKNWILDYPRC